MASVSSLYFQSVRTRPFNSAIPLVHTKGLTKFRNQSILCFQKNDSDITNSRNCVEDKQYSKDTTTTTTTTKRREALFQILFASFSSPLINVSAAAASASANNEVEVQEDFRVYSDDTNKFKIMIPQDWEVGAGQGNGIKSLTAFYPPVASDSNVSVLITGLGADFTRLESFGKVDAFAETLISGLDRSWQRPPGVTAKLIDAKAAKGFYYIEYSLQKPGESCRHIFSTIGMASNGWYNRLYTVTGQNLNCKSKTWDRVMQFVEQEAEKYKSKIEKVRRN
ncbi:Photosystem II PsbP [Macleaya cordata]|uniref:Photosystem II PsbP n=1 Tax=Macleaya cordata TaxID=56857 RepID=A0A200PR63_MACCD|nr:Photosystem II PsbP [Macleaya cordata]